MEEKIRNLTVIVIIGFVILFVMVLGLYFRDGSINESTTNSGSSSSSATYDVSKMTQVSGEEAARLFDEEGTHVLYIGRSGCSICVQLVPQLNQVIDDWDLEINYLPLGSNFRTEFADLFDKLSIETEINNEEGTYGELLEAHGYTPFVIVIQDGKMVDGFVGSRDADTIKAFLEPYVG